MSRVLVIGGWPPSLINFRGELLQAMRARGHEVIACAGGEDTDVSATLQGLGIRYVPLPLDRAGLNPLHEVGLLWRLYQLMRSKRPDIVLAYTVKPVVYGMLAARFTRIRGRYALITGLGYAFIASKSLKQRLLGSFVPQLYRIALVRAAGVIFQNNDDKELFREHRLLRADARPICVLGSGVNLDWYPKCPLPSGAPVFLMIARLLVDKGVREYVAAARSVRSMHANLRFALLGPFDSNPAAISREEVSTWVNEGAIEYWGETKDVRPFLAQCSVYVLPSYREGMPRTVLEAMATGRPVITTDVPGCRDTVREGENGYLVPARDSARLAQAMCRCIEPGTPLAKMGDTSRQIAEERFGVHKVNRMMLETMGL